jgi:hypothetical protein
MWRAIALGMIGSSFCEAAIVPAIAAPSEWRHFSGLPWPETLADLA